MRKPSSATLMFAVLILMCWLGVPRNIAAAHEGHKMECTETSINAMNADIQAMDDGDPKTSAMKEMQIAQDLMTKKDMEGCMDHMHGAMEAMEK